MESSTFRYSALSEPDSIRLLLLQPSDTHEADLRGDLVHTTIRERELDIYTGYIAMSYVWGDPTPAGFILLGGCHRLLLTASLDSALRGIRHASVVCPIWADAVCIDQGNIAERNQQVALMRSIYTLANHTVIFLGQLTPDAEWVLGSALHSRFVSDGVEGGGVEGGGVEGGGAEAGLGRLRDILSRPWFTRTWILQELVLSRDPQVQCGWLRVPWDKLCSFMLPVDEADSAASGVTRVLQAMQSTRSEFRRGGGVSLVEVLSARRAAAATDPRDLVYGLLGMVKTTEKPLPEGFVDYDASVEQVYVKTARHILSSGSGPRSMKEQHEFQLLLSAAEDGIEGERGKARKGLPSWVPDWKLAKNLLPLPPTYSGVATKYALGDSRPWCAFVGELPVMICGGSRLPEAVGTVSPVFPAPSGLPPWALRRCRQALVDYESQSQQNRNPSMLGDSLMNLCQAIQAFQGDEPSGFARFRDVLLDVFSARRNETRVYDFRNRKPVDNPFLQMLGIYVSGDGAMSQLQGRRLALLGGSRLQNAAYLNRVSGTLAVVPCDTQPGDICVSLQPSQCLYVVREELHVHSAWKDAAFHTAQSIQMWEQDEFGDMESSMTSPSWHPTRPGSVQVGTWGRLLGECYPTDTLRERRLSEVSSLLGPSDHVFALL